MRTPTVGCFARVRGDGCAIYKVLVVEDDGVVIDTGCWEPIRKVEVLSTTELREAIADNRRLSQWLLEEADDMERFLNAGTTARKGG